MLHGLAGPRGTGYPTSDLMTLYIMHAAAVSMECGTVQAKVAVVADEGGKGTNKGTITTCSRQATCHNMMGTGTNFITARSFGRIASLDACHNFRGVDAPSPLPLGELPPPNDAERDRLQCRDRCMDADQDRWRCRRRKQNPCYLGWLLKGRPGSCWASGRRKICHMRNIGHICHQVLSLLQWCYNVEVLLGCVC